MGESESLRGSVAAPLMYSDVKCARPGASIHWACGGRWWMVVVRWWWLVMAPPLIDSHPRNPSAMDPYTFQSIPFTCICVLVRARPRLCMHFLFFCHLSDIFFSFFFFFKPFAPADLISISMAARSWGRCLAVAHANPKF